jgi:hypothetical protein
VIFVVNLALVTIFKAGEDEDNEDEEAKPKQPRKKPEPEAKAAPKKCATKKASFSHDHTRLMIMSL